MLEIIPVSLSWLGDDPWTQDLCAHSGVKIVFKGETVVDDSATAYTVSTGAVHLLRTLDEDHTEDSPLFIHIFPCCGHFMVLNESGQAMNAAGCGHGLNWWIEHKGSSVHLTFSNGSTIQVSDLEWCQAVITFADRVWAFYRDSAEKQPFDEEETAWFSAFMDEWQQRRVAAPCTPHR